MIRRTSRLTLAMAAVLLHLAGGCGGREGSGKRVIVLGFDGMDHRVTSDLMAKGRMPNFSRVAATGTFASLGTSIPPQSPVAWSRFITGLDPGGHGIFDFIHRDPETMIPCLGIRVSRVARGSDNATFC